MDIKELLQKIDEYAAAEISLLPVTAFYCWFPSRTTQDVAFSLELTQRDPSLSDDQKRTKAKEFIDSLQPTIFRVSKPVPMNPDHTVVAIFQGDTEVSVYATDLGEKWPVRYRLNRNQPNFGVEIMQLETFCSEVAEEWDALAGLEPGPEEPEEKEKEEEESPPSGPQVTSPAVT